ncbi:MAG: TerC family protein [Caldilineaceae bacterium]|nr:TerC family protein [Caldilineaceae bacterium]
MFDLTAQDLVALLTLTALEIVLGIDNVIFIAILAAKLPVEQQARARTIGIGLAVITRILLLLSIAWIMRLNTTLFTIFGAELNGRDLILLAGGLFLIGKSTFEIHEKLEAAEHRTAERAAATFAGVVAQIILIDIVFSLDSVITAVGISGVLMVMVPAIVIAAAIMLFAAGPISRFVERHPTMKILALAFLIAIGVLLVFEGWNPDVAHGLHLRNYIYFGMAFSFVIELINMRLRPRAAEPVHLHNRPSLDQVVATTPAPAPAAPRRAAKRRNRR